MKRKHTQINSAPTRSLLMIALLSTGLIVTACGGGSDSGATGSGASTASSSGVNESVGSTAAPPGAGTTATALSLVVVRGPVTALSGITVGGIRYEDRTATVRVNGKARGIDDVRLGMMVEIEVERNDATSVSSAKAISATSFAEGRVDAIDRALRKITVMGIQITVPSSAAFEGLTGLDDPLLVVGDYVEVYGMTAGATAANATRIEKKTLGAIGTENLAVTGTIAQLNKVNQTFLVSGTSVAYGEAKIERVNAGLANGMTVRVEGIPMGANAIRATEINGTTLSTEARDGFSFEDEGIMTNYDSPSATFTLNGVTVVASNARMDGLLAEGARVKVHGAVQRGKLIATKVERVQADNSGTGSSNSNNIAEIEITASIKMGNGSFQIGAYTVRWDSNTRFDGVSAGTLQDGMILEVRAARSGSEYLATRIKRE